MTINRRDLLGTGLKLGVSGLVLTSLAPALSSCGKKEDFPQSTDEYDIWREMRDAIRTSPDHTLARSKTLVSAGDRDGIFRFVRDEIRLMTGSDVHFRNDDVQHCGVRAALRSGSGTTYEKAAILTNLLKDAGHDAELVFIARPGRDDMERYHFRTYEQPYAPEISDAQIANWQTRLGLSVLPEPNGDALESKADETLRQIRSSLSSDDLDGIGRESYDPGVYGSLAVVRIWQAEGADLLANPHDPSAELIPWPEGLRASVADKPPQATDNVSITVSGTSTDAPDDPFELVRADWSFEQLAGRQVRVAFDPAGETLQVLASRIKDIRNFTPVLKIQAIDGEEMDPREAMVLSRSVSLEADVIELDENDDLRVNGHVINSSVTSGLADRVASVSLEADASTFPDIRLKAYPRDASGALVEGLAAGDFSITDASEPVSHMLRSSDIAPRILFLADESLSMPQAFRGAGPKMVALKDRVTEIARTVHPNAQVSLIRTNSNLWEHLLRHSGDNYNLIVYATDGDVGGRQPTPGDIEKLRSGPKQIVINVDGDMAAIRERYGAENTFDRMADATNGEVLEVGEDGDTAGIEETITAFLQTDAGFSPYTLVYRASVLEEDTHEVALKIGSSTFQTQYTVPENAGRARKLASIQLTIRIGRFSLTRTLAGHDGEGEVTDADLNALHGAMWGTHILAFEGSPPGLSTLLDDLLTARLSFEELDRVNESADNTIEDVIDELDAEHFILPDTLLPFMMRTGPLSGDDFMVTERGLRVALLSTHGIMNTDQAVTRSDVLPFAEPIVFTPNRDRMLEVSFENSIALATVETGLFDTSTNSLLEGQNLVPIDYRNFADAGLDEESLDAWRGLSRKIRDMFPGGYIARTAEGGGTRAVWVVCKSTGLIYGLLPDATGGGTSVERVKAQLAEVDRVVAYMNMLIMVMGMAGGLPGIAGAGAAASLGIVAIYGQFLGRLYAAVTISIILMDASGIPLAIRKAIAGTVCELKKHIALTIFGAAGKWVGRAVNAYTVIDSTATITGEKLPVNYSCSFD